MARGDVVSNGLGYVNYNVTVTFRPSSGDEWMVTGFGSDNSTSWLYLNSPGGNNEMHFTDRFSTSTSTPATRSFMRSNVTETPIKWFLSNTAYITGRSQSGYHRFWFMGIKTKE